MSLYKTVVIVDVDGTLSVNTDRFNKFSKLKGNGDLVAFHSKEEVLKDPPIHDVIKVVQDLAPWNTIVILSARHEKDRHVTEEYCRMWNIPYDMMILAPDGDETPAHQFKVKTCNDLVSQGFQIICCLDDCHLNIAALRESGFTAFHVRERGY